jgi:hypothetical protein
LGVTDWASLDYRVRSGRPRRTSAILTGVSITLVVTAWVWLIQTRAGQPLERTSMANKKLPAHHQKAKSSSKKTSNSRKSNGKKSEDPRQTSKPRNVMEHKEREQGPSGS